MALSCQWAPEVHLVLHEDTLARKMAEKLHLPTSRDFRYLLIRGLQARIGLPLVH